MEAAGGLVVASLELSAGVEDREDHFERALLRGRVFVDWDAAAVVFDRNRGAVLVKHDANVRCVTVHCLVDGVVKNFPDQVVEPGRTDASDVHARTLADGLEPLQNRNVFRGVVGRRHV